MGSAASFHPAAHRAAKMKIELLPLLLLPLLLPLFSLPHSPLHHHHQVAVVPLGQPLLHLSCLLPVAPGAPGIPFSGAETETLVRGSSRNIDLVLMKAERPLSFIHYLQHAISKSGRGRQKHPKTRLHLPLYAVIMHTGNIFPLSSKYEEPPLFVPLAHSPSVILCWPGGLF